jgi:hypothetical protein
VKTLDRRRSSSTSSPRGHAPGRGKLQVELAQLSFRLGASRGRKELSRLGGGVGTAGTGEKKLEEDRRGSVSRSGRSRGSWRRSEGPAPSTISTAGSRVSGRRAGGIHQRREIDPFQTAYGADVFTADKLFATLDPHGEGGSGFRGDGTRSWSIRSGSFHDLPSSCGSVPRDARGIGEADLLLHVADGSSEAMRATTPPWTPSSRSCLSAKSVHPGP